MKKEKEIQQQEPNELKDFPIDVKRSIVEILNDTPSLVMLGDKGYRVQNMRWYSVMRICNICMRMRKSNKEIDDDNAIITALCTDLDAMSEIMAVIMVNHLFTAEGECDYDETMSRNDKLVQTMKAKVLNSTYEVNQWAAIIIGAMSSIDLSGFFLLTKSVSMLTDSLLMRKKKSQETASQFTEALSLQMRPTS